MGMDFLTAPLKELSIYEELERSLKSSGFTDLSGLSDSGKAHIAASLQTGRRYRIVVAQDDARAQSLVSDLKLYLDNVAYYPARDLIFYQSDLNGSLLLRNRLRAVKSLLEEKEAIIVTTFDAFMEKTPGIGSIESHAFTIEKGGSLDTSKLSARLTAMGYHKESQVEEEGQFALRGGIIDIYPLTEDSPIRIELWGDDVDSIRVFDSASQRSIEELESIKIYPASELILTTADTERGIKKIEASLDRQYKVLREKMLTEEAHRLKTTVSEFLESIHYLGGAANAISYLNFFCPELSSILDFFPKKDTVVFLDEPVRLTERGNAIFKEFTDSMGARLEKGYLLPESTDILFSVEEVFARFALFPCLCLETLDRRSDIYSPRGRYSIQLRAVNSYNGSFPSLVSDLKRYRKNKYRVVILSPSRTRAKRLAENLQEEDIPAFFLENRERLLSPTEIATSYGNIQQGFEYPDLRFAVISESDIFGVQKKKKRHKTNYEGQSISSFNDLSIGDYVIHESYGIGKYEGIEHIEIDGVTRDYVKISYRDEASLYVIASNLDSLQKYASRDAEKRPKLNKLGGKEWARTREKVKGAVEGVAKKLVELYASRLKTPGYVYGPDTVWQTEFEELFPYEETDDQNTAIAEVKRDMESSKIMDRLICGDVGFGKTEVAIRAAFKAVQENKQVAFLVPTTILAEQHYNTIKQRMKDYPIKIDLLCRFKTAAEQKKTISDLKKGQVDIVIGTHRLLSKDVAFKDLGLLVIDEEQRFGVTHKEKIKELRKNVDVLALTATPIPRTLHMSLVGIRDMSVLEEAPGDRMPIQTFIMEYSEEMVREAINRELARHGQVYFVYNRTYDIADRAAEIRALIPGAEVAYAHGQMKERELEDIMSDFINGAIDILVSTTIIETGIDIPNVNTMIIYDADRMGLSQLYQLRGRVGRSNRVSYAFLMYRRDMLLKETAEKRLNAIREFTELGSGFKIAMKDLEIRGAGNVLGAEQSGHMEAVGYDLYCRMLDIAVKEEKGEEIQPIFNTTIDIDADAFIPEDYVKNENTKLDLYKRIASIDTEEESEDMASELSDRFGPLPESVKNLIDIALVRQQAHRVFIDNLQAKGAHIDFHIYEGAKLNPSNIEPLLNLFDGALRFSASAKPFFSYKFGKGEKWDYIQSSHRVLEEMSILLET